MVYVNCVHIRDKKTNSCWKFLVVYPLNPTIARKSRIARALHSDLKYCLLLHILFIQLLEQCFLG